MISELPGKNQQNGKQSWLPLLSFKISLKDTSFHICINVLGLYLSPECLLSFLSYYCIPPWVGKTIKLLEFTFLENALIRDIFTHAPPNAKLAPKFLSSCSRQKEITHSPRHHSFENLFSSKTEKRGRKPWFAISKFRQKIRKDDLEH